MKIRNIIVQVILSLAMTNANAQTNDSIIQIVYTSDLHYGFFRKHFEGQDSVASYKANAMMLRKINALPGEQLPKDDGVAQGKKIDFVDDVIITGDITNREEKPYQSATISWQQFENDYIHHLTLRNKAGQPTSLLLTPGNHDASNAIGYYKPMQPVTNPVSMINIYNLMMHPETPKTIDNFDYFKDAVNYSRNIGGIHFMFLSLWPDSATRIWMEKDLEAVPANMPVLLFTHVPPQGDPKHFFNPHTPPTINKKDKFENLLQEHLKDSLVDNEKPTDAIEQKELVAFLKQHPNIKAYFHGHENANEYYNYTGPDNDISIPVFRVDSPMKGKVSAKDETILSFQFIAIDPINQRLTVRECLWNKDKNPSSKIIWGESKTISIKVK